MHVQVYAVPFAISCLTTSIVNHTKSKFRYHFLPKAYYYKAANTSSSRDRFVHLKKPKHAHVQVSAVSSATQGSTGSNVNRPKSNFHPALWDDHFLSQAYYDEFEI
ncbi:hypothetical protein K2173_006344 [Erythroxylum novogranatense]|uniref:Uncharacterized protein n=1 Tax=Erythroxylum novogranatense TaxID=1862640 RepID=A0AAV8U691_9ROSI|nr:hypothetical protein K2173_006344 [Erythroxylum novogranatense]